MSATNNEVRPAPSTIYIKHKDGKTAALNGRKCAKLCKEILAGRGGPEITKLVENGYEGFLARDGQVWDWEVFGPTTW